MIVIYNIDKERVIIFSTMMSKVLEVFKDPKQITMAVSGLLMLGYYVFFARKEILGQDIKPKNQHDLNLTLKALVNEKIPQNIIKIVLTEPSKQYQAIEFRSEITSRLKAQLLKRGLTTLINCSPLKILNSGCECLLESLTNVDADDQQEMISYYENALRCQLVIQKTIVDIESIKKENKNVYILCDTNSMDIRVNSQKPVWDKFLEQKNITQDELKDKYKIVFHIRNPEGQHEDEDKENKSIKQVWKGFNNYNEIVYDNDLIFQENVSKGIEKIMEALEVFIPPQRL